MIEEFTAGGKSQSWTAVVFVRAEGYPEEQLVLRNNLSMCTKRQPLHPSPLQNFRIPEGS